MIREIKKEDQESLIDIVKMNYDGESLYPEYFNQSENFVYLEKKIPIAFCGFSQAMMDGDCFEIFALNTHPDHRNKMCATKLLKRVIKTIKFRNKNATILLTCEKELISFYEERGFFKLYIRPDEKLIMVYE